MSAMIEGAEFHDFSRLKAACDRIERYVWRLAYAMEESCRQYQCAGTDEEADEALSMNDRQDKRQRLARMALNRKRHFLNMMAVDLVERLAT